MYTHPNDNKYDEHKFMRVIIFLSILIGGLAALAQDFPPPLTAPTLAYTDAQAEAVYLYDLTTTLTRRLVLGEGAHTVWDFSPDGCRMLVTLTPPRAPSVVVSARLDGSDVREMVDVSGLPAGDWDAWEPDWSPQGDRIALTVSRTVEDGRESRVGWIPADGGEPTFYSVAGDEHTPRWSPDGNWLAYVSYEPRPAGATITATAEPSVAESAPLLREADVWKVSADGLTKERITRFDVGSAARPVWSPDGQLLAFVYSPQPGDNQFWMIAAVPDAIPTQLSFNWNDTLDMVWSPEGDALTAAVRNFGGEGAARLWSLPLIGNADTDAVRYFEAAGLRDVSVDYPRFHPSGAYLAFRSEYALMIVNRTDDTITRLDTVGNTPPVWSPAGFAGEASCAGD